MFRATRLSSRMCLALVCAMAVVGGSVVFADHHEGKMMMKDEAAMSKMKMDMMNDPEMTKKVMMKMKIMMMMNDPEMKEMMMMKDKAAPAGGNR